MLNDDIQDEAPVELDENGDPIVQEKPMNSAIDVINIPESKNFTMLEEKLQHLNFDCCNLFVSNQPVMELLQKDKVTPVNTLEEVYNYITSSGRQGLYIQRYKGLGEMNPEQLWETTMSPETRKLMRVELTDAQTADETFTLLMGDKVEPRKEFIQVNAKYAHSDI